MPGTAGRYGNLRCRAPSAEVLRSPMAPSIAATENQATRRSVKTAACIHSTVSRRMESEQTMIWRPNRREFLSTLGMGVMAGTLPRAEDKVKEIRANSVNARGPWYFDPAGLFIEKGETVRWVGGDQGPTVTAFHPSNYNHELRIPEDAKPFHSGNIMRHGRYRFFELTFDV